MSNKTISAIRLADMTSDGAHYSMDVYHDDGEYLWFVMPETDGLLQRVPKHIFEPELTSWQRFMSWLGITSERKLND